MAPEGPMNQKERIVLSSGSHNCGGRCLLKLYVRDGRIVRISGDDEGPDAPSSPQLRSCARCRSYRDRLYHPDRLTTPLRRVGPRGTGAFAPATWEEALEDIASSTRRLLDSHGPDSLYLNYATGNAGLVSERVWMRRLLGLAGGYLDYYGTYSAACADVATPYVYGTTETGSSRETWAEAKLIILWGFNPAETIHGTNTAYYLKLAREAGARIVCVDPLYTSSASALADQWIPVRPTTDVAFMDAMAYVMVTEGLHDQAFLNTYCLGFDEDHLPPGAPEGSSYLSYLLGRGEDGKAKTPDWAERITGVPARTIVGLARDYATSKPAALLQGLGPQRHAYGEQFHRAGPTLAAMTGNVGVRGGWAAGTGYQARRPVVSSVPRGNPNPARISVFTWPDAILHGAGMGSELGVRGVPALRSNIKMIFNLGGNCLVNQHTDSQGTAALLKDESLVERIVVSEHFMTPSAAFADWVLPSDGMWEREDIVKPWDWGDYLLFMNKAADPPGQCRNGYDWISSLAELLGLADRFTEGLSLDQWLRRLVEETAAFNPGFPSYEEFRERGVHRWVYDGPDIAFRAQIEDPAGHPFPTKSGKIEIFSEALHRLGSPEEIPAIPRYIKAWEGPEDPLTAKYPLQCIGHHTKRRVHSTLDNVPSLDKVDPQAIWMNPEDAAARGLIDGDSALVYNDRGRVVVPVKITLRIMPGVVSIPQGAWWRPGSDGVDRGGCVNVLSRYKPTPLAFGNPSHTSLVQVRKAEEGQ